MLRRLLKGMKGNVQVKTEMMTQHRQIHLLKRISLILVLLLTTVSVTWYIATSKLVDDYDELNFSNFRVPHSIQELDPTVGRFGELSRNLYLTAISYVNNFAQASFAKQFYWDGAKQGSYVLKFRRDIVTKSGYKVTAKDFIYSLKRALLLKRERGSNHVFIDLFCSNITRKNINEKCDNIEQVDDYTIELNFGKSSDKIIKQLDSTHFAVIPKISVNWETLKLVNLEDTSGGYFVREMNNKKLTLKRNKWLQNKNKKSPNIVNIYPGFATDDSVVQKIKSERLDFISSKNNYISYPSEISEIEEVGQDKYHMIYFLVMTQKGMEKFSPKERLYIAKEFKKEWDVVYKNKYKEGIMSPAYTPFISAIPWITEQIEVKYKNALNRAAEVPKKEVVFLGYPSNNTLAKTVANIKSFKTSLITELRNFHMYNSKARRESEEKADFLLFTIYISHLDSIDNYIASHVYKYGIMNLKSVEDKKKWSMEIDNLKEEWNREVHYYSLVMDSLVKNPSVVPLLLRKQPILRTSKRWSFPDDGRRSELDFSRIMKSVE